MAHLEVLLQALSQWVRDLVEANELTHTQHLCMVTGSARVQPLDNCRDIPKYTCIHKSCKTSEDWALWLFLNQSSIFSVFCSLSHMLIIYIAWNRCEKRPLYESETSGMRCCMSSTGKHTFYLSNEWELSGISFCTNWWHRTTRHSVSSAWWKGTLVLIKYNSPSEPSGHQQEILWLFNRNTLIQNSQLFFSQWKGKTLG
jgi:hypothetical protein